MARRSNRARLTKTLQRQANLFCIKFLYTCDTTRVELSEAESCLCIFVVDVSKAATLIGNVFRSYVRDLGLEKINTQGDVVLQSKEETGYIKAGA